MAPRTRYADGEPERPAGAATHLTTEQLADRYGVAKRTVEDWRTDRTGPPYVPLGRSGRTVRYRLADVEEWEKSRLVVPAKGGLPAAATA